MRELPRRESVRRVALVHDCERRDEIGVGEVGIELLDLRREEKPLVDDRPRRAGADVCVLRRLLDLPADDVEAKFEGIIGHSTFGFRQPLSAVGCRLSQCYEHLPYPRHDGARVVSDGIGIRRHVAPGEDLAPLALHRRLDLLLFAFSAEYHRHAKKEILSAISVSLRLCVRERPDHLSEERVRNLHEKPCAVACLWIIPRRAAVHESLQNRHALLDDVMARLAGEVGDHPDAARVVFVFAPVESVARLSAFVVRVHCLSFN